ncbi:MAG: class I SAM-dependent RNA methyltransferase [Proteobacteria bacterium]|nr:class I SAM-dependent RNA methyltransferase [Pseudomonadota bacterium]
MTAVVEVTIEEVGSRGDGVARHQGAKLFVPFAAAGDRARVRIGARRADGFAAALVEIVSPGPGRGRPPCRHFGACGGCALQHLDEGSYAAWKRGQVIAALAHRGLDAGAVADLVRARPLARRRARFVAERRGGRVVLGFNRRASHEVIELGECPVLLPGLFALAGPLGAGLAAVLPPGGRAEVAVNLTESGADAVVIGRGAPGPGERERLARLAEEADLARLSWQRRDGGPPEPIAVRRPVRVVFGGVPVEPPPGAFLQATAAAEGAMTAEIMAALAGVRAPVADLFAGCGTFTFPLAAVAPVEAVEGDAAMVAAIRAAAGAAGLAGRVRAAARDLDRAPLSPAELAAFGAVVFDPPRTGARRQAAEIAASPVPLVVAVSCHPGTFARDARLLVAGGYRLDRVLPVDQFLWSPHVEIVAVFRRIARLPASGGRIRGRKTPSKER